MIILQEAIRTMSSQAAAQRLSKANLFKQAQERIRTRSYITQVKAASPKPNIPDSLKEQGMFSINKIRRFV